MTPVKIEQSRLVEGWLMQASCLAFRLDQVAGNLSLACISDHWDERKSETFDTAYLNRLFAFGHASGMAVIHRTRTRQTGCRPDITR
jgi:hypothetical protein